METLDLGSQWNFEMTREEQLDALIREALSKVGEINKDLPYDSRGRETFIRDRTDKFHTWLRAEFIRTQAP